MNKKLISFIEEYNPTTYKINEQTRVFHDLNIYGDDAEEFLSKYSKVFDVDISEFDFKNHFPEEGNFLLSELIRIITLRAKKRYSYLTIKMLSTAIDKGYLK